MRLDGGRKTTFNKAGSSSNQDGILLQSSVNSNQESAATVIAKKAPVRFCVAALLSAPYWFFGGILVLLIALVSGAFLGEKEHRDLGKKIIAKALGWYVNLLEFLRIIIVDDGDLKKHAEIQGPVIIACNHPAMWDALLVVRRFGRLSCIMKTDLELNLLLRSGARFAGFLPNAPRMKLMRKAVRCLKDGGRLLLFPEGTRTRREEGVLNPLRPGLALMAQQSGAGVLPVFIRTNSPYLGKGWPIWKMPEMPISISMKAGEVMKIGPQERVREFSARIEQVFRSELAAFPER